MKRSLAVLLAVGCLACPARGLRPDQPGGPEVAGHRALRGLASVGPAPFDPRTLRGKVVLVSFFATWCFPCLAELPVLEKLQREHAQKGFTVVMVGMDLEGAKVLRPFAEEYALPYPMLVADDWLRSGQSAFGQVRALPTVVLFNRDGEVVIAYQGVAAPAKLLSLVDREVAR